MNSVVGRYSEGRRSSKPIRTGRITFCSTNISTGTMAPGLGASHQTGWTGLVAKLIELFGRLDGASFLQAGKAGAFVAKKAAAEKVAA